MPPSLVEVKRYAPAAMRGRTFHFLSPEAKIGLIIEDAAACADALIGVLGGLDRLLLPSRLV